LKSGASLISLEQAEAIGDASKAVELKLDKRDCEIADDARKRRKRLSQRVPTVKLAF
jgi:hypothetical protein